MMKVIVLALSMVLAIQVSAQTPKPEEPSTGFRQFSIPESGGEPKNAHDWAVKTINELMDYRSPPRHEVKPGEYNTSYISIYTEPKYYAFSTSYVSDGKYESVSIGRDGKIELHGISIEDAFLMLEAFQAQKKLDERKAWDHLEDEREKARNLVPPSPIKVGSKSWLVFNEPTEWGQHGVLADTNCNLRQVRSLESDGDKRDSIMHEIMHVATNCRVDGGMHEAIYALAPALVKILRENPDLVEFITEKPAPHKSVAVRKLPRERSK